MKFVLSCISSVQKIIGTLASSSCQLRLGVGLSCPLHWQTYSLLTNQLSHKTFRVF